MQRPEAKSFKQLTISVEKLPGSTGRQESLTSYAAERARLLLGCYRTGDANDPETYVAAITAILARYPEEIITSVTHPATGLPQQKNWLPTIKEVADACAAALAPILERQTREKQLAEQIAARHADDSIERPTRGTLEARYGKDWGMTSLSPEKPKDSKPQSMTPEQLRHHYQHYDLGFKPKDGTEELSEHLDRGFGPSTAS